MTQAEMAAILNISPNYYGQLERGLKLPSFDMIKNFIKATGKDANYWFGIDQPKDIPQSDNKLKPIAQGTKQLSDLKFSEIHAVLSQLYVYLDTRAEPLLPAERRMLADILAACQRLMDSDELPFSGPQHKKTIKVINH